MKKVISFSAICILTSILFSSCKSNLSVTKRHYNNGYYIAHSTGKHISLTPKEEVKIVQTKTKKSLYAAQSQVEQTTISGYSEKIPVTGNNVITASAKKIQSKTISQKNAKQTLKHKIKLIENPIAQLKHRLSETKKVSNDSSDKDGLSLFWIIILVILILWAIGFFEGGFGLGALINLLLLVALILFILWLLRIL